jgi:two-component system response regulator AauR
MATPASVLIVDGNPHMIAMLQRYLTRQQVDTQAALSLTEAQALLAQQAFRVVLTDTFLPSDDGLNLLRYICQMVPGTRVILMTALSTPALCRQALAAGAYACLTKPFKLQEFWKVVQSALQGLPALERCADTLTTGAWAQSLGGPEIR